MFKASLGALVWISLAGVCGCGSSDEHLRTRDGEGRDAGSDAGGADAPQPDASTADAGSPDAGTEPREGSLVGPAGGLVTTPEGFSLEVPPGALEEEMRIQAQRVTDGFPPLPGGDAPAFGPVFEVLPHGLSFAVPARLTIPHATRVAPRLTIYTAQDGGTWAPVGSAVSVTDSELQTEVMHLSFFAHNWTCEPPYEDEEQCGCYHPTLSLGGPCRLHLEAQPDICCPGASGGLFCAYGDDPSGGRIQGCCPPLLEGCTCPGGSGALTIPDGTGSGQLICWSPSAVGKCVAPTCP